MSAPAPTRVKEGSQSPALPADHAVLEAITSACRRIPPLWPLKHFVAVNPFMGHTGQSFATTCATLNRVARARMLMPRDFYRKAIASGIIDDDALKAALAMHRLKETDVDRLKQLAERTPDCFSRPPAVVATVAEVLDSLADGDRSVSLTAFMIDEISSFCASYFDEGQASWPMPRRKLKPYAAWRSLALYDCNPEVMGIKGFRASVRALPEAPVACIRSIIEGLGIPERAVEDYLYRPLFDVGGWAAYARYMGWNDELNGNNDDTLVELLAIRLAWGWALFNAQKDDKFRQAWRRAMDDAARLPFDHSLEETPELAIDLVLQEAYEIAYRRRLLERLSGHLAKLNIERLPLRPQLQAAFCIDVRSEIFRRALETTFPEAETIGFAGFFGFPIEYVPIGQSRGGAQCPVLLKPSFVVCEAVKGANTIEESEILGLRLLRRRASKAWKSFKSSAVSSFTFVETTGLGYLFKIATDSLSRTRPVPSPYIDGLDEEVVSRIGPRIENQDVGDRVTGFTATQKVDMAEAVLKAMSLTGTFARFVLLAGHGSTSVNNPHASALDCGACGGHTGEANARVAAAILNDAETRQGLAARRIIIPSDTWFLAALHDTTTDEIKIFDEEDVPKSHATDLINLKWKLTAASVLARRERSKRLGLKDDKLCDRQMIARSRDWSQVRPEWGLAGNAAFIAAPRRLTRGLDLAGRAFLHSYEHHGDQNYEVLELIMTAPMIVASWINLQYYGSTVNNVIFGSGNKVLHNVVGQLGVLEGNAGDLRVGLPWQSVHDGKRYMHEPIRLNVFIAAPEAAIDDVLKRRASVRDLVVNRWLFLHSISDDAVTIRRCMGPGDWREF